MATKLLWSMVPEWCTHCGRRDCPRAERMRLERERILAALDLPAGSSCEGHEYRDAP